MTTYTLGVGNKVLHEHATFNHATGFIYRAQGYGTADRSVFDVQASVRSGAAFEGEHWATAEVQVSFEQATSLLNPAWRRCPFCTGFHPKGSEC